MYQEQLYDITQVCKMLGTTSRTLRFYEEKGIIQSTTVGTSARRQYSEEQLSLIKNVLVLRTLGLSVKAVAELQTKGADLKDAVLSKRAEIYASIDSRIREINLLNEALSALESGKDIFTEGWQLSSAMNAEEKEIARICTDAILSGDTDTLYNQIDVAKNISNANIKTLIINSKFDKQSFDEDLNLWPTLFSDSANVSICVYDDISHLGYKIDTTDSSSIYTRVDFPSEIISAFTDFIKGD